MKAIGIAAFMLASFVAVSQGAGYIYQDALGQKGLYYSAGAYCAYETISNWQCGRPCQYNGGLTNIFQIKNYMRDTFAFAGYNSQADEIVLAFRGTNGADLENWITNIKAISSPYPGVTGAQVHSGFFQAYNDVKTQVNQAINSLLSKYPGRKIFITGHSLGGALAVFAAVDIKANLRPTGGVTLYTYGQPRTGNPAFSDYIFSLLDGSYIRVTHYDDTVAHVPPRVGGFKHAGNELWFKNKTPMDNVKQECPNSRGLEENGNCSNSFWLKTGIWSHTNYMGIEVSGICTRRQPGGTLLGQSIDEAENYEQYSVLVDSEASNVKNFLAENSAALQ